jgi:hypothetical protein
MCSGPKMFIEPAGRVFTHISIGYFPALTCIIEKGGGVAFLTESISEEAYTTVFAILFGSTPAPSLHRQAIHATPRQERLRVR